MHGPARPATGETSPRWMYVWAAPLECSMLLGSALHRVVRRPSPSQTRHDPAHAFSMSADAVFGAEVIKVREGARALLVGSDIKRKKYKTLKASWDVASSLDELGRLCETAGLEVMGRTTQAMQHPSPSTFLGSGKVEELRETVSVQRIESVVFDEELSPAQGRNLQDALGGKVQVLDRTMLILFIFAQRARTREAKLQVAAAQGDPTAQYSLGRVLMCGGDPAAAVMVPARPASSALALPAAAAGRSERDRPLARGVAAGLHVVLALADVQRAPLRVAACVLRAVCALQPRCARYCCVHVPCAHAVLDANEEAHLW